jgi:hypothetical protein
MLSLGNGTWSWSHLQVLQQLNIKMKSVQEAPATENRPQEGD